LGFREREVREMLVEGLLAFLQGDQAILKRLVKDIWKAAALVFTLMFLVLTVSLNAALGAVPLLAWFLTLMVRVYALYSSGKRFEVGDES
jgi:hypothetical protein